MGTLADTREDETHGHPMPDGVGYGMRPCETCAAPLVYPDEQHGATCVACEDN